MVILGSGPRCSVRTGDIVFALEYITSPPSMDGEVRCLTAAGVGLLGACFLEEIET
jgi:hypothetical protein